jgi:hypothetical protein
MGQGGMKRVVESDIVEYMVDKFHCALSFCFHLKRDPDDEIEGIVICGVSVGSVVVGESIVEFIVDGVLK